MTAPGPTSSQLARDRLQPHYESMLKQVHAARLGMWLFLASEILLFSALFALYASYRAAHVQVFRQAVQHTTFWAGTVMTVLLITSSLAVALAVSAMRHGSPKRSAFWIVACIAQGVAFLGVKFVEYHAHFLEGLRPGIYYSFTELTDPAANIFFTLYYLMTGLHALHVLGGLIAFAVVLTAVCRGRYDASYYTPLELTGLYWHLVDIIWVFLWPLFYLMR